MDSNQPEKPTVSEPLLFPEDTPPTPSYRLGPRIGGKVAFKDLPPEVKQIAYDYLKAMDDFLESKGDHEGHTLKQVGRCIYCSCGKRVQGKL